MAENPGPRPRHPVTHPPHLPAPANDPRPCVLGRFCESTPIGRNLLPNPNGEGLLKWSVPTGGDAWRAEENWEVTPRACIQTSFLSSYRWCQKKQVSDLEEEGLWPELLDSGKTEIFVSDWWTDQQYTDSLYGLTVQPLDANQAIHHYSPLPFPSSSVERVSPLRLAMCSPTLRRLSALCLLNTWFGTLISGLSSVESTCPTPV